MIMIMMIMQHRGGDDDDDLPDLVPDSDYEVDDEEFEESLTDHDSDEIAIIQ